MTDGQRYRRECKQEGKCFDPQLPLNYRLVWLYFAIQTFFGSVKKRNASSPPSRPTPLCFIPPKGTRRSRTSQQFTQTVPVLILSATRWARLRFCVQTLEARPYSQSLA